MGGFGTARARSHLFPSDSRVESWLGFGPLKGWAAAHLHSQARSLMCTLRVSSCVCVVDLFLSCTCVILLVARIKANVFGDEDSAPLWWKRVAIHAAKSCVHWQPTVILREWCLPRAVLVTLISFQAGFASASFMVPLRDSSDSETPPIVSDTCWADMKLVAVSWTLEIPLNKYTEELLDAIYRFIVDVSSVHALHASAVSTELRTRFAELRQVTSQFRVGSCEVFGRDWGSNDHVLSSVLSAQLLQTREQNTVNTTLINARRTPLHRRNNFYNFAQCKHLFFFTALQNMKWTLRKVRKSENQKIDFLTF